MKRIPSTFAYPVIYPNGAVIYCETEEEANMYRKNIEDLYKWLEEQTND